MRSCVVGHLLHMRIFTLLTHMTSTFCNGDLEGPPKFDTFCELDGGLYPLNPKILWTLHMKRVPIEGAHVLCK